MSAGQLSYYTPTGARLASTDPSVTSEYAEAVSRETDDVVEWISHQGASDVRYYLRGQRLSSPPWARARPYAEPYDPDRAELDRMRRWEERPR